MKIEHLTESSKLGKVLGNKTYHISTPNQVDWAARLQCFRQLPLT